MWLISLTSISLDNFFYGSMFSIPHPISFMSQFHHLISGTCSPQDQICQAFEFIFNEYGTTLKSPRVYKFLMFLIPVARCR